MLALVCIGLLALFLFCIFVPRLAFPLGVLLFGAVALSGCVSLGLSQAQSENDYTIGATAADVFLISGKATGDAASQICFGDTAAYKILIATRNVGDGVKSYAPADNAHVALHTDGARLSSNCVLVPAN
jgi:hypothetical protein